MRRAIFCLAATCAATQAFAQSAPSPVTRLSPLTVTAPTGTRQPVDSTLAPVIVLDAARIKPFWDADIATLLQFQAGLDIARNGGPGQPASLFLRGTGSAETQVRVDGIRVNPGSIGGPPLANILSSSVGRVEIVEAPRSALYGSDAIGGLVDISLRQPTRDGFDWGAGISGGHNDSRGSNAYAGGGNGTLFGGAGVDFFETGGFPPLAASTERSAWRNLNLHAAFGAQGDTGEAYATVWQSSGTSDYLDFTGNPVSEDYTDRVTSVHLSRQMNATWSSRLVLGQYYNNIQQVQSADFLNTWRNSADWRNDLTLGGHNLLSAGIYLAHQHVNALSYGTGYDQVDDDNAAYAQDQIDWGIQRLVLAGRLTHFSSFGSQFTWNTDYGLRFSRDWRLTVGAGTGFRAPTATDRYGYGGNPDLLPEYSHSLNAGLYHQIDRHARIALNLYRNRVSDLITFEATSTGGQETNIGQATITGVNLSAQLDYGAWHIRPGINIQRPLNDQTGGYLPRRTRRSVTLNLDYSAGTWRLGAHFLAAGPTRDSDFSTAVNAGYVLTTLTAGVRLAPHWHLRARLENAFNVKYQTVAGYASPGRGLYFGIASAMP
jgi:vitamin B12 transporter